MEINFADFLTPKQDSYNSPLRPWVTRGLCSRGSFEDARFSAGNFSVLNSTHDLDRELLDILRRDKGTAEVDIFFLFFVPRRSERTDGGLVSSLIIFSLSCMESISVNFLGRAEIVGSSSISWAGGKWAILSDLLSNSPLSTVSFVVELSIYVSLSISFSFSSSLHVSSQRTLFLPHLLGPIHTSPWAKRVFRERRW